MQEKSLIKKNILKYLDFKGISEYKLYKETGISRGILRQNNGMSEENTARFLDYCPEINPEWLLTGKGEMLKSEKTEQPVAQDYGIPLIPLDALAGSANGSFAITRDDIKEYYNVPEFRHADFMIKVAGASMQPKYYGGDVVACKIVKDWTFFQWNRVYVLDTAQGAIIKRIKHGKDEKHLLIVSENENYEPFEIAKKDIYAVALVIGVIRLE